MKATDGVRVKESVKIEVTEIEPKAVEGALEDNPDNYSPTALEVLDKLKKLKETLEDGE